VAEALCGAGMQRHNAGFVALRLEDVQLRRMQSKFALLDL
jgi:hypothetical protein